MCSQLDDPTHPDNQDEIDAALAEVERWLTEPDTETCCTGRSCPQCRPS